METKFIEIRDAATCIPALAIRLSGADSWLARHAGFAENAQYVILTMLNDLHRSEYDPHQWGCGAHTMPQAHRYIIDNWDQIPNDGVVDVEFVLGITKKPKVSDRFWKAPEAGFERE